MHILFNLDIGHTFCIFYFSVIMALSTTYPYHWQFSTVSSAHLGDEQNFQETSPALKLMQLRNGKHYFPFMGNIFSFDTRHCTYPIALFCFEVYFMLNNLSYYSKNLNFTLRVLHFEVSTPMSKTEDPPNLKLT